MVVGLAELDRMSTGGWLDRALIGKPSVAPAMCTGEGSSRSSRNWMTKWGRRGVGKGKGGERVGKEGFIVGQSNSNTCTPSE
jgi:hypothetical protein